MHLAMAPGDYYPFEHVKRKYHGQRPAGIDVVHVVTDDFSGGYSDRIGGVAYQERGFSTGNAHDNSSGLTAVGTTIDIVPAGVIAAHEIGHELGARHQMISCAEAAPQEAQTPRLRRLDECLHRDGTPGPAGQRDLVRAGEGNRPQLRAPLT
jgi:hypothetical protein